jgi:class 3 adenylate cyclase
MFPLPIGIGIDAGEAVPVEDGYRGVALNTAARLCSKAAAGQVFLTQAMVDGADIEPDEARFVERGPASFKGFEQAVEVIEALAPERPVSVPTGTVTIEMPFRQSSTRRRRSWIASTRCVGYGGRGGR